MVIYENHVELDLKQNEARVWREAYVNIFTAEHKGVNVFLFMKGDKWFRLVRMRGGKYYLVDEEDNALEIGVDEAKTIVVKAFSNFLRQEYQFEIADAKIDFRHDEAVFFEKPKTVRIFDEDGRFYVSKLEWIERRGNTYLLFDEDNPSGREISEEDAEISIESTLETEYCEKPSMFPEFGGDA